jgi:hypothetical protein
MFGIGARVVPTTRHIPRYITNHSILVQYDDLIDEVANYGDAVNCTNP